MSNPEPMDAIELQKFIGRKANFEADGFSFRVRIQNARWSESKGLEFLALPVSGQKERWMAANLLDLDDSPPEERNGA